MKAAINTEKIAVTNASAGPKTAIAVAGMKAIIASIIAGVKPLNPISFFESSLFFFTIT